MANPYGDIELTPRSIRALAHPVRLAILSRLQGSGPSTATALAPLVGATPSVTSWHLRHLAEHGLVQDAAVEGDGRTFPGTPRNAKCPCGSGKKYKLCHGLNEEE